MTEPPFSNHRNMPDYSNLTGLNSRRLILDSVGRNSLEGIAENCISLLGTFGAVYEANGDYALRIISSGWCRYLHDASRLLCQSRDDREALNSGR